MNYELMIPFYEDYNFNDLNKKQAKEYFEWYVNQIENRIEAIKKYLEEDGEKIELDYSPESLIPLWEWYEKKIVIENKTEEEYQQEVASYPEWMKDEIPTTKISLETIKYGMDIAIYFAEVIIRNNHGKVQWGYFVKPKNRVSVNQPVLLGFKGDMELNHRAIVNVCTIRSSREYQKTRLYDLYRIWIKDIK